MVEAKEGRTGIGAVDCLGGQAGKDGVSNRINFVYEETGDNGLVLLRIPLDTISKFLNIKSWCYLFWFTFLLPFFIS